MNDLVEKDFKKFDKKEIKEYLKQKLLSYKESLEQDISLNQTLAKEILQNLV